jgi:hypothetical protein
MRLLSRGVAPALLALVTASCFDFQRSGPAGPNPVPVGRYATVTVQYRQPQSCFNTDAACTTEIVWFFGSWMKKGDEVPLSEGPGRVWTGSASHVPVNWPPRDDPHYVRVYDPHLKEQPSGGVTAARLSIGGQAIYYFDQPGTPQESGLIYVDDNGVGRNPY